MLMLKNVRKLLSLLPFLLILLLPAFPVYAQETQEQMLQQFYEVATVLGIAEEQKLELDGEAYYVQLLQVRKQSGEEVEVVMGSEFQPLTFDQRLLPGQQVILTEASVAEGQSQFVIADSYRIPVLLWLLVGFFAIVTAVSGWKGLLSILGMFSSLLILTYFVLPLLLSGMNPIAVALLAALIIALITVYVSHGFKPSSHIALISMLGTLVVVTLLSYWYVILAKLVGMGSEEAIFLQLGETATLNMRGLLLSGIMLGALGVLDDITISQVSTVFEIKRANKKLPFQELYASGMRVGRDHIASLVNTLVLAYVGANLPLLILFTISQNTPSWVLINNELLAEEIVRTLIGSIGLVMAVPLTTALAAYWASKNDVSLETDGHHH